MGGFFFFFFRKERYNLERPIHNVIRGTLRLIATRGEHCSAIGLDNSLFLEKFKNEFESRTDNDYVRPVQCIRMYLHPQLLCMCVLKI